MKRKKNKLSLALFSLRAFVGKISVSLYTPQCNFLTTYTRRFGTSKLLFQVLEEFHFFFLVVFSCHPGTERHFFFFHPLPTLKRLENNKRILKTPIIIDVFFFLLCVHCSQGLSFPAASVRGDAKVSVTNIPFRIC